MLKSKVVGISRLSEAIEVKNRHQMDSTSYVKMKERSINSPLDAHQNKMECQKEEKIVMEITGAMLIEKGLSKTF